VLVTVASLWFPVIVKVGVPVPSEWKIPIRPPVPCP